MNTLSITATDDIESEHINSLINRIGEKKCSDSGGRISLCNTTPPSFIEIIGTLLSWQTIFVASATVFFSTLSKRLAEDLYSNKQLLAEKLFIPVKLLANSIIKALNETANNTFVRVEIAAPRGVPNPGITFLVESEEEIAFKLSCFYAVSTQVIERISIISKEYEGYMTPPVVSISEKGDVTVRCYAGMDNDHIEFTISLINQL